MKKSVNKGCLIVIIVLIISCGYNVYQYNKIKCYKEQLTDTVRRNIQRFAGKAGNIENEYAYAEQYSSIVAAQEAYIVLSDKNAISSTEYSSNLSALFIKLKYIMINDKTKFKEAFMKLNGSELMFKISEDFQDKESIEKVYKILNE